MLSLAILRTMVWVRTSSVSETFSVPALCVIVLEQMLESLQKEGIEGFVASTIVRCNSSSSNLDLHHYHPSRPFKASDINQRNPQKSGGVSGSSMMIGLG